MPTAKSTHRSKLTPKDIQSLATTGKRYRVWDTTQEGLHVMVTASGAKSWYVSFRSPITGQAVNYRIGVASVAPSVARAEAKAILGKVAAGEDPQAAKMAERSERKAEKDGSGTLQAFIRDTYAPEYLAHRPSGRETLRRLTQAWKPLRLKKLGAITEMDIARIRRERLKSVTPATWNRDVAALRACMNYAVKSGQIAANPFRPGDRVQEVDANRARYLGQRDGVEDIRSSESGRKLGEADRFWAAVAHTEPYLRVLVTLAMKTGARQGELFSLRWGSVNLDQGTITLEAHTTKSRRKRVVPLPSTVLPVLREWKPEGAAADDLVVASPVTGERLTNVKRGWAALLEDARITGFRWHDMRHDYASRLVQAGADIFRVSRLLGHSDPALTAKRYAALAPDHLRDVVELLA